jgi:O-antigen/teichoic acid export membrane protein
MPEQPDDFRKHALVFGIGSMLIPVSGVLLLPLYVNYLSAEQFGILELVNQLSNVLCICFLSAGVYHATGTFYLQAKDNRERGSIAATVLLLYLAAIGVGLLLVVPLLGRYGGFFGVDDFSLLLFGLGGNLVVSTLEIPYVIMRCRMESVGFVIVTFLQFLLRVLERSLPLPFWDSAFGACWRCTGFRDSCSSSSFSFGNFGWGPSVPIFRY